MSNRSPYTYEMFQTAIEAYRPQDESVTATAERCGISGALLYQILKGYSDRFVSPRVARQIANAMGFRLEDVEPMRFDAPPDIDESAE